MLPSWVEASSCVTSASPLRKAAAAVSRSPASRTSSSAAAASARVDPCTAPSPSKSTAASIWDEISVKSANACEASIRPGG